MLFSYTTVWAYFHEVPSVICSRILFRRVSQYLCILTLKQKAIIATHDF